MTRRDGSNSDCWDDCDEAVALLARSTLRVCKRTHLRRLERAMSDRADAAAARPAWRAAVSWFLAFWVVRRVETEDLAALRARFAAELAADRRRLQALRRRTAEDAAND